MSINTEQYGWWTSLKHGGLLIAPGKLGQYFPAIPIMAKWFYSG